VYGTYNPTSLGNLSNPNLIKKAQANQTFTQAASIQNIVNGQPVKCQALVASNSNLAANTHTQGLGHTGIGNSLKQPFLSA
jgi:hypothetical protein